MSVKNNPNKNKQENKDSKSKDKDSKNNLESLKNDLLESKKQIQELEESLKKSQADLVNYQKRSQKNTENSIFIERKTILSEFLIFLETLKKAKNNETDKNFKENLNQLESHYRNILNRFGVKKIDILNKEYDYNYAECLSRVPVKEKSKNNIVLDVIEDGYLLNNKLLKPAKVVVGYLEE